MSQSLLDHMYKPFEDLLVDAVSTASALRVLDVGCGTGATTVDIAPIDVPCVFPASELESYVGTLGPVGRSLQNADADTRASVMQATLPAFDLYLHGTEIRFNASCLIVDAHVGDQPSSPVRHRVASKP